MAGMLKKAMRGAAQAGAAASIEAMKADIIRKRDERLQAFDQTKQQQQWDRDDVIREQDRQDQEQASVRDAALRSQELMLDQSNKDRDYALEVRKFERGPGDQFQYKQELDENGQPTGRDFWFNTKTGERGYFEIDIPSDAIAELLIDPSPESITEFEEIFGPGSASRFVQTDSSGSTGENEANKPSFFSSIGGMLNRAMNSGDDSGDTNNEVSAEELTEEQIEEAKKEVSAARAAGQKFGEDLRLVMDEQGRIVAVSAKVLSDPARRGLRLVRGAIGGIGEFLGGALEGDQQK